MDAENPYNPPATEHVEAMGSLAQSARGNELKGAQRILVVIGVLTIAVNGFLLYNLPTEIRTALTEQQIAPEDVEEFRQAATLSGYLVYGLPFLLGVTFVVFGAIINQFPVPITVAGLSLYLLATVIFALLYPETLVQGIVLKVIFIYALFRAVKSARAYEAHTRQMRAIEGLPA